MIQSGQLLNRVNLNAAFMSKTGDNSILGNLITPGNINAAAITASGLVSSATLSTTGNATIGGTLTATGALTASAGINIPTGQTYKVNGVALSATFFGLGNVTNESKATMFTNPAFTGTPTAPTATLTDNSTQIATTAFVKGQGYITKLFDDTAPKLYANLDTNGKTITTAVANGNVTLSANGSGSVNITTNALFNARVMIGNASTYFEKDATNNQITTPNAIKTSSDIYLTADAGRIYLGASNDAVISRGGTSIVRIGDGTSANNLYIPNGYLSVSTATTADKVNVGGNVYIEGTVKYNDVSRYWLSTASNWGLYWNTTDNALEFHGAGGVRASIDLDNGNASFAGTLTSSGALTAPSATINSAGLKVTTILGGDGGWANGIIVENTAATTGEASIAFKNAGTSGTGSNYWFQGLNGGTSLDFGYGTSFTSSTKMSLNTSGGLSVAGGVTSAQDMYVGANKVWHEGNLQIEPIEVLYEEFTATEGQTLFTLTQGAYPMGMNLLTVYIWGAKQPPGGFSETTTTSFTLSQGVPAGTKVLAEWFEVSPNLKGEKGDPPEHEWLATELRFRNPTGTWGSYVNLKGEKGDKPSHEWSGTQLRMQNPDGSWGSYVNLQGIQGVQGVAATLNLGTVSFLDPNQTGYVTNVGNANDAIFNIGIPKGSTVALHGTPVTTLLPNQSPTISNSGANGNSILQFGLPRAPQVSVGTVTTLLNSQPATVTNTGSNGDVVLNFGLPAGKGITNIVDNLNGTVTMYYGESLSSVVNMSVAVVADDVEYTNTTSGLSATTVQDAIDEITVFATAAGTDTYTITASPITAYTTGQRVMVKFTNANTGASTININGLGAKSITKAGGGTLAANNLKAGGVYTLAYDGTSFQLQGEGGGSGTATASDLLSGKTAVSDAGDLVGTIPSKTAETFTPGTTNQTIAAGQYLSGIQTISGDADLISANIKSGANIFGVAGLSSVVDTASGTAAAGDMLSGKTAYVNGSLVTGTISSKTAATYTPGTTNQTIAAGQYLSGIQTISGDANLAAANIKSGISIFGVTGTAPIPSGTATAARVLAGYTFSNASGVGLSGSMVNRGAPTWTPSSSTQSLSAGYYSGGTINPGVRYATGTWLGSSGTTVSATLGWRPTYVIIKGTYGMWFTSAEVFTSVVDSYDSAGTLISSTPYNFYRLLLYPTSSGTAYSEATSGITSTGFSIALTYGSTAYNYTWHAFG